MMKVFRHLKTAVLILVVHSMQCCTPETNDSETVKHLFKMGDFRKAQQIIDEMQEAGVSEPLQKEFEITSAKIKRIQLDFSKTEDDIRRELAPYFPDINDDQLHEWEKNGKLEMRVINGTKKYFRNAVPNFFRLDSAAQKIRAEKEGERIDPLKEICLEHTNELIHQAATGKDLPDLKHNYQIDFSITVDADAVPAGEVIKCWMPFPRKSLPRQDNIQLLDVNQKKYKIADNDFLQRSLYMEKTAKAGEPTVFSYSAQFETSPQWIPINLEDVQPYKTDSELYQKHTTERPPHIIFTNEIKKLAKKITSGIENPYEKVKSIYYWIDTNIPWTSALEYSTFESIPAYTLENRRGDCGMQTLLFMSLARYSGIPCKWQSGWMLHPGEVNLHDWCEVYYEGIGWVPLDQSFGLQNSDNPEVKEFYITGIDAFRLIINDDFGREFYPQKKYFRSEPIDFQRGEVEWKNGNIYFNDWDYKMEVSYLNNETQ